MVVVGIVGLCGGCLVDASKLAGYSNPSTDVSYNPWTKSFHARTGADFTGTLDGEYDPDTKRVRVKLEVGSNASGVVQAEGERAEHLVELRKLETQYLIESQRIVGDNFRAFGQMLAIAAAGGGEAVAKMVDAAAPILKGSALKVNGLGSIGLGETVGPPAVAVPGP